jgi:Fe-S oxidoreductase
LTLDVAGLVVTVVTLWAAIRRYIIKPERLKSTLEAGIILLVVFSLMLLNYAMQGFRLLTETKPFAEWLFVGMAFSRFFVHLGVRENSGIYFWIFWWLHITLIFGFSIYVLYSKHLHILASPFNLFFRPMGSKGSLQPIEDFEKGGNLGVSRIVEFTWKKLLDLYACTDCGRCTANCPASMSGMPLKPREIIQNLKAHLLTSGEDMLFNKDQGVKERGGEQRSMVGGIVTEAELWACTTCHACVDVCPVEIEHVERIVGLRRHLVMREARFPTEYKRIFKNLEIFGDPFGAGSLTREEWLSGLRTRKVYQDTDIEILLWVGCTGALYDEKTKSVTVATAKVLNKAGVRFGILGKKELCCGDPARRMGNEYLFQELATRNIKIMRKHGIRKLVTFCPHCLNVFRNEYPQFGADFEVVHITEMIRALLENGKLQIKAKADGLFTYHDPCYLGRYNQIHQQPRDILEFVINPPVKEMALSKNRALCCGAGGGNFWIGRETGRRIEELRIDQAVATGSNGLITACPFCEIMFDSAIREKGLEHSFKITDVVQIIDQTT